MSVRTAGGFQGVGAHHHRGEQFDGAVGQRDAEHVAARGQRRVTPARRLCHQMLAAATHQRAGFRGVAQCRQRQEERGIAGTAPPAGQEQSAGSAASTTPTMPMANNATNSTWA